MLTAVAVSGYRSLRDVVVPLHGLDVVTGANGSGKSSLYRSLRLLAGCGRGDVIGTLAREGGLQSALWAGPATLGGARDRGHGVQGTRRKGPISLQLGFASDDFGYLVDLGLPQQASGSDGAGSPSAFLRDPEIKREVVWSGPVMRPGSVLVRRRWGVVETRAAVGGDDDWASDWGGGGDDESAEWESDPVDGARLPGRLQGFRGVRRASGPAHGASGVDRADPVAPPVGEHAHRARRPRACARAAPGASDDPGLALLRRLPCRRRGAGPDASGRHPHPGARRRRPRPRGGPADDPRERPVRSSTAPSPTRSTARSSR